LDLPGGFVDGDETAEEAIIREIDEELKAKVVDTKYLFSLPNQYEYSGLIIPTLDLFFACMLEKNSQLVPSDDVAECFYIPIDELQPEQFGLMSIRKAITNLKMK